MKKNKITEIVIEIFKIVSLIVVSLIGIKYIKDSTSFLDSEDVKIAKEKIKEAKKEVATSKEIRQAMSKEVQLVKEKSIQHKKLLKASKTKVDGIKDSTKSLEDQQKDRQKTVGDLLKKNIDG